METISQRIKRLMTEKGLRQKQVVIDGAISQSHFSKIAQGKVKTPSLDMLNKMAKGLQVELQELLVGTDCEGMEQLGAPVEMVYCLNLGCEKTETATLASSGETVLSRRFYTARIDGSGREVKFCPFCGKEMIHCCPECDALIFQWNATHCTGCGKKLFELVPSDTEE